MRIKKWIMKKKIICVLMVFTLLLSGCTYSFNNNGKSQYKEFIVVDVFDSLANYQGLQSGWFAKIIKDKFNMQLNIIAPNVAGGGDTLFETRVAAGNLGDLVICSGEEGNFEDMVNAGLLLDMSEMLKEKDIMRYEKAILSLNNKVSKEGIYAIPSEVSDQTPLTPNEGLELTFGPYLRWDAYSLIGYPRIETLEELLPILQQMQQKIPYSDSGKKTYAFSFFKDWDGNMMNNAKQPACLYGYDEIGFVLAKVDGSDYQDILGDNSFYLRNLKLYFNANQMGMVDPASMNQNYEDVFKKYQDGQILYSPWPWLGKSAYNTSAHVEEGKGFMLAPIDDMQIMSYGCNPEGNQKTVIGIGSQTKDPSRLADFIDWLYSPEGIQIACAEATGRCAGPKGLTWEEREDGYYLTDFGIKALYTSEAIVPEDWGGGNWKDGLCELNYKPVSQVDKDPKGYPYYYSMWDSVMKMEETKLDEDWKNHMGADSVLEYLEQHNQILVAPGSTFVVPESSAEISTIRGQCRKVIVEYSWEMVFAENEKEFYNLLNEMRSIVKDLGYETVLSVDFDNARLQNQSRTEAIKLYND